MSILLPELLDLGEAVTIRALLVALRSLLIWAGALAALALVTYMTKGLLWLVAQTIGRVRFSVFGITVDLGKYIEGPIASIAQGLTHEMGVAANNVDKAAGRFFYGLRRIAGSVGQEILGLSILGAYLVWWVAKKYNPGAIIRNAIHTQTQTKITHAKTKPIHGRSIPQVPPVPFVFGIPSGLPFPFTVPGANPVPTPAPYPIPHGLPGSIPGTLAPSPSMPRVRTGQMPNLWEQVKHHTKNITNLWKWIRTHGKYLAGAGAVALVWTALGRLGIQWVRCRNWQRLGRGVCGLPSSSISGLLSLLTDVLVLVNVCQLIPLLETAASDVAVPLVAGLTDIGAGICYGSAPAAELAGPSAPLPPVYFKSGSLILPT